MWEGDDYQAGVKNITVDGNQVEVYCDEDGYTTIQSRGQFGNDIRMFYKDWDVYLNPFGVAGEEFWFGLDNIYKMTNHKNYSFKLNLVDQTLDARFALWDTFRITDNEFYTLEIGGYRPGPLRDAFGAYHNGMKFSTWDRDNDEDEDRNCAAAFEGAWWFRACHVSHLNGVNYNLQYLSYFAWGISYIHFGHPYPRYHSLKSTRMSIKAI